jgi:polysaccharide pyruvyl transferase CsaB
MKVRKLVINGYYGLGNAGDEAVLASALNEIRSIRPDISITVLSGDPPSTAKRYGVDSVQRRSFAAIKAIRSADLYVSGGGSLLQDTTSAASILYYLAIMFASKLLGTPYAIYANGVGPIRRGWARGLTRMAVEGASSVSVRDAGSMRLLEDIGVLREDIALTADPVFAMKGAAVEIVLSEIERAAGREAAEFVKRGSGRLAVFSLRDWAGLENGIPALCEMSAILKGGGFIPIGLAFQPGADEAPLKQMAAACGEGAPIIPCDFHPEITAGIFKMAAITVGMRLHSLIMSASAGVPALGISYDPKVDSLFEMLPLGRCVKVSDLKSEGPEQLKELIGELDEQGRRLTATLPSVQERAADTAGLMLRKAEEGR